MHWLVIFAIVGSLLYISSMLFTKESHKKIFESISFPFLMLPMMCLMAIAVMEGVVWVVLTSWWLPYFAPEDDPNRYEVSPINKAMGAIVLSLERLTDRIKKEPPSDSN